MQVKKVNGKKQPFDKLKIENSIKRANREANKSLTKSNEKEIIKDFKLKRIANKIEEDLLEREVKIVTTNEVSKLVEDALMSLYKETAWHYITYHHDKEQERLYNNELIKQFQKKLNGENVENSNANCDERSFSGRMNEAATLIYKDDALHSMSAKHRRNHENNVIYIHDLSSYSAGLHNCLSIPFDELFHKSLYTKQTDLRPPRNINTAMQLVAVIIQIQSLNQFGGVSATHLDWTLVPFVRYSFFKHLKDGHKYITKDTFRMPKDIENTSIDDYKEDPCYQYALDMTTKDTLQGAEGLIHNLN